MDYQEAIKYLEYRKELESMTVSPMLERKIARVEAYEIAISAMQELQQYKQFGDLEEVRAAVDKQMAEKPLLCMNEVSGMFIDYADGHGEYKEQVNNWWRCPCCNSIVGQRVILHCRTHDQRKKKFCEDCGQKIDWSVSV